MRLVRNIDIPFWAVCVVSFVNMWTKSVAMFCFKKCYCWNSCYPVRERKCDLNCGAFWLKILFLYLYMDESIVLNSLIVMHPHAYLLHAVTWFQTFHLATASYRNVAHSGFHNSSYIEGAYWWSFYSNLYLEHRYWGIAYLEY
jgi:hypothetical protein